MNIKATIPQGHTEITVNGLHQWDYGRKLEIHSKSLPALIEVHFACAGMKEAVVRSCSVTNGVAIAAIPDRCLEQTTPITAWVYGLDGTSGTTTAKITLAIEPRTRPCPSQEIPVNNTDKYTEAVVAMNEAVANVKDTVDTLAKGDVLVGRAIADENGNTIPSTYATNAEMRGTDLRTDICAKVEELVAKHLVRPYWFKLGGDAYEKDDAGNPVNLPARDYIYGFATVYTYYNIARVFIWGASQTLPVCYNTYHEGQGTWSGWVELIDKKNAIAQSVNHAKTAEKADEATRADEATKSAYLENNGLKFGRVKIWETEAFNNMNGEFIGWMLGWQNEGIETEYKTLTLPESPIYKTLVIKICRVRTSDEISYRPDIEFTITPFMMRYFDETADFTQNIDGVTFTFKIIGRVLYFKADVSHKYLIRAVYEEL